MSRDEDLYAECLLEVLLGSTHVELPKKENYVDSGAVMHYNKIVPHPGRNHSRLSVLHGLVFGCRWLLKWEGDTG